MPRDSVGLIPSTQHHSELQIVFVSREFTGLTQGRTAVVSSSYRTTGQHCLVGGYSNTESRTCGTPMPLKIEGIECFASVATSTGLQMVAAA